MSESVFSTYLHKLSAVTRSKDWRLSFVPFIFGCLYLWMHVFSIQFSGEAVTLLVLSLLTTFGFASLGYFINEFFDKAADARAGKLNKLAFLPWHLQFGLFAVTLVFTFSPWLWLPADAVSKILIKAEILLFLLYSLPFPRLKNVYWISSIIDSLYAYVVPLLLAYHTYSLFSNQTIGWAIWLLAAAVFFIGFRNITIHHIDDVFNDKRAGICTLPQKLGVSNTNNLILLLMLLEMVLFAVLLLVLGIQKPLILFILVGYVFFVLIGITALFDEYKQSTFAIHPLRHFTDKFYQVGFPLFTMLLLVFTNPFWLLILPLHFLFLVPDMVKNPLKSYSRSYLHRAWRNGVIPVISASVNYSIYILFRLVGINLIKENTSAKEYIKRRFS